MNTFPDVWVECGADLDNPKFPFTRKHYYPAGQTDEFRQQYGNCGVYETVMKYVSPVWVQDSKGRMIINTRESLKYGDFYMDFDTKLESDEDFEKVRADVKSALRYLKVILSIDPSQVSLYFSGHKGIHLTVDARVLGIQPHLALNQIYKEIASDIAQYCKNNTLDLKVYDDKRMFRMVNSLHKKSGRYKVPISHAEFERLSLSQIRDLAIQPRYVLPPMPQVNPRVKHSIQRVIDKWTQRINQRKEFEGRFKKLEQLPVCIQTMLSEKNFRETVDERNNSATALTSFFMQQGIEREETLARMKQWSEERCLPPLPARDIEIIVNSVYNGGYRYGCESFRRLSGVCDRDHCPLFA
ncbi:primase C-terminal domain-containing protein [Alicyclobacillus shizuokensis]|uniref:primase C-terminal domain-containing protein n=1 Tax=Alicyclobacillus shizuokensis TaxID=392014 RepID=UPI00082A2856|nr:primase C-terminal domain-containing protein [Alicyclobacillus shizuokensis]